MYGPHDLAFTLTPSMVVGFLGLVGQAACASVATNESAAAANRAESIFMGTPRAGRGHYELVNAAVKLSLTLLAGRFLLLRRVGRLGRGFAALGIVGEGPRIEEA